MKNSDNTFLFLPDISGFSAFVNQTEINHSKHIIAELMDLLLKANKLRMDVVEIEGDAIFFFSQNQIPTLEELFTQTESMFLVFHNHLEEYEAHRICKCGACSTAHQLTLKFIAHSGPVELIKIGKFKKLHGNDVIVSHRLMKNEIASDEYLLVTKNLLDEMDSDGFSPAEQFNAKEAVSDYENTGQVKYTYFDFRFLHHKVETYKAEYREYVKSNTLSFSEEIFCEPHTLFDIISNLKYRKNWNRSIKNLYHNNGEINKAGDMHTCVINNMKLQIETIPVNTEGAEVVYGERVGKQFVLKNIQFFYTIIPEGDKSKLKFEISYQFRNSLLVFMKPLVRRMMSGMGKELVKELKHYAENEHKALPVKVDINKMINNLETSVKSHE